MPGDHEVQRTINIFNVNATSVTINCGCHPYPPPTATSQCANDRPNTDARSHPSSERPPSDELSPHSSNGNEPPTATSQSPSDRPTTDERTNSSSERPPSDELSPHSSNGNEPPTATSQSPSDRPTTDERSNSSSERPPSDELSPHSSNGNEPPTATSQSPSDNPTAANQLALNALPPPAASIKRKYSVYDEFDFAKRRKVHGGFVEYGGGNHSKRHFFTLVNVPVVNKYDRKGLQDEAKKHGFTISTYRPIQMPFFQQAFMYRFSVVGDENAARVSSARISSDSWMAAWNISSLTSPQAKPFISGDIKDKNIIKAILCASHGTVNKKLSGVWGSFERSAFMKNYIADETFIDEFKKQLNERGKNQLADVIGWVNVEEGRLQRNGAAGGHV